MRTCLDCGEPLKGRSDKKFCSDQCRNSFNNRQNREELNFIRNVQNILRRNRRILFDLKNSGIQTVHRDELITRGFNFHFHTSTFTNRKGRVYYFCFEQGFLEKADDYLELVIRDDYVTQSSDFPFS
ncbi:MAG: DUF2116 family Zn-ribbon domain-containing protein [Bacteroidales bacterium]|nr:MAG: DUF2116 family Zn-ribbon domain-containing protein [Bacteroidales bacterium]